MKSILRHLYINLLSLYLADLIYPGFSLPHTGKTLLMAAAVWFLLNKIVKPILKLLLLPINLITLGLFSWVISLVTLLLLQYFVDGILITTYHFPGLNFEGFIIPSLNIGIIISYLITSVLLQATSNFIVWISHS